MSGDTTSGGVSRISKALESSSPDFVLIELGGNDALRGYPLKNIEKNLEKIVNEILNKKSKPILMQIKIPPNYGKKYVDAFENEDDKDNFVNGELSKSILKALKNMPAAY